MASSSEANDPTNNSNASQITIELEEEIEGDYGEGEQYYFDKIGVSVPLNPNASNFSFDLHDLPQRPLAVSERFRLIFVADLYGFFVARTKDIITCAKEMKDINASTSASASASASSIKELSLVNVPVGKVHILALSSDNSRLAVTVLCHIYIFSVDSLINGETKHLFSTSLPESESVKDISWKTNTQSNFVVLSRSGYLYSGGVGAPLRKVLNNVDAVGCSVKSELIAIARNNLLSIFSPEFKEQFRMLLSSISWSTTAADENFNVKVDSIRWIRPDCIVLGCFQLSEDRREENYFLQIIRSRDGQIGDVSSEILVHSFTDLFSGIVDDVMPFGSGPYLTMSYLDQCQLSITANRKNTDGHIVLLGFPADDASSGPCVLHIERDKWVPRIELQENGDDNLVLGLCVDRVSILEKVNVQVGLENRSELLPFCILICLTLDGRLIMFHVASETGTTAPAEFVSAASTDESFFSTKALLEGAIPSPKIGKKEQENVTSSSQDMNKMESINQGSHACPEPRLSAVEGNKDLTSEPISFHHQTSDNTKNLEVEISFKLTSTRMDSQKIVPSTKPDIEKSSKTYPQYQQTGTETSASGQQKFVSMGPFDKGNLATAGAVSSPNYFLGKTSTAAPSQSSNDALQFTEEMRNKSIKENEQFPSSHVPYGSKLAFASGFSAPSVSLSSQISTNSGSRNMYGTELSGNLAVRVSNEMSTQITADSLSKSVQSGRQRGPLEADKIEAPSSNHGSRLLSSEKGIVDLQKSLPSRENRRIPAVSSTMKSEPNLPKQLQHINETFKELDMLLESIEETGGYKDACTTSLKNSIETLEQGMANLSKKCKVSRNLGDERLKGIQYLLDNTVQVLARKICMEGIIEQASDSRYWNLWNRQKLNSELELKRQHILKMHHEMIDQLIQLERHFNALELNKYGETSGTLVGDKVIGNRYGPSRYIKSLHSLHSAMTSQLVTAEHLSECLSKQLAVLSVNSSSQTQKNVKKEMFEMIGIPYDDSFCSPVLGSVSNNSFKGLVPSGNSINQDLYRSTAVKNCEPESGRRRRESLDQSWASFQPSQMTVKRITLREVQKAPNSKFMFPTNTKGTQPRISEWSGSAFEREPTSPVTMYGNNADAGRWDKAPTNLFEEPKPFVWSSNVQEQMKFSRFKTQTLPDASHLSSPAKSHAREAHYTGRLNPGARDSDSVLPRLHSDAKIPQRGMTHENSILNGRETSGVTSKRETVEKNIDRLPSSESLKIHDYLLPASSGVFVGTISSGQMSILNAATSENRVSPSPLFTESHEALSFSVTNPSSVPTMSSPVFPSIIPSPSAPYKTSTNPSTNSNQPLSTTSFPSVASVMPSPSASASAAQDKSSSNPTMKTNSGISTALTPPVVSSASSPFDAPKRLFSSSSNLSLPRPTVDVPKSQVESAIVAPKPEAQTTATSLSKIAPVAAVAEAVAAQPSVNESEKELKTSAISGFPGEAISSAQASDNLSSSANLHVTSQLHQSTASSMSSMFFPSSATGTGGDLDVGIEDEMEEEAPETTTAELNFGNLGGFGLGSMTNSTSPKPNPFGPSFSNTASNLASSVMPPTVPTGELFRPASFTLQSAHSSSPPQSINSGSFSGGFATGATVHTPGQVFGQPSQIGSGQQALGSVLGTFGQSRQLGNMSGPNVAPISGFGRGFASSSSVTSGGFGGFSSAATSGGFAGIAATGGGFGGFASAGGAGGFGAFSKQQGNGGFPTPMGGGGNVRPPELFTMIRK